MSLSSSSIYEYPEKDFSLWLRTHENPNIYPTAIKIVTIWTTNCWGDEYGTHTVVAAKSSRINHSCVPNSTKSFNMERKMFGIRALVNIATGTEITLSYTSQMAPYEERLCKLAHYDFTCECPACDLKSDYGRITERRRTDLSNLEVSLRITCVRLVNVLIDIRMYRLGAKPSLTSYQRLTFARRC